MTKFFKLLNPTDLYWLDNAACTWINATNKRKVKQKYKNSSQKNVNMQLCWNISGKGLFAYLHYYFNIKSYLFYPCVLYWSRELSRYSNNYMNHIHDHTIVIIMIFYVFCDFMYATISISVYVNNMYIRLSYKVSHEHSTLFTTFIWTFTLKILLIRWLCFHYYSIYWEVFSLFLR
jgi:hypothetical protein